MAKEKEVKQEEKKLKFKVVSYADFLAEARELAKAGPVQGMTEIFDIAVSLVYDKNEVIGTVQKGGETRYVVKV